MIVGLIYALLYAVLMVLSVTVFSGELAMACAAGALVVAILGGRRRGCW